MLTLNCTDPNSTTEWEHEGGKFEIGLLPRSIYAKFMGVSAKFSADAEKMNYEDLIEAQMNVIRWAVKGHSNLAFSNGKEVPFNTEETEIGGRKYTIVSDSTLDVYFATNIWSALAIKCSGQEVSGDEGKAQDEAS